MKLSLKFYQNVALYFKENVILLTIQLSNKIRSQRFSVGLSTKAFTYVVGRKTKSME